MDSKSTLKIVASECGIDDEDKFNKWYNEVHIPLLLKYRGITRVGRYKQLDDNKEHPKYLAFYEFESKEAMDAFEDSPEFATAMKDMDKAGKNSGFEIKWVVAYEPIKTWEK
jgi:uncharacterized protein (TIGR02118 family)